MYGLAPLIWLAQILDYTVKIHLTPEEKQEASQEIAAHEELAVSRGDGNICGRECCHK